jgi:hypothetical protein
MKNLSTKTKLEIMLGKLVIMIIQTLIGFGALLTTIWLVCSLYNLILNHTWAFIVLGIVDIILFVKMLLS